MGRRERLYPFEALAGRLGLSAHKTGELLQISGSTMQDYRARGLTEQVADRLAVRAGLHPACVWTDWVDNGLTPLDEVFLRSGWRQAWLWAEDAA